MTDSAIDLRPNIAVLVLGAGAIALVSAVALPWPLVVASTLLGALMIAGADVDARTYLLPDVVTWGAVACGILAAAALDPMHPALAAVTASARAAAVAAALALLRAGYAWARGRDGIGFGDVKLAAAVGAWLPLEAVPMCFGLAAAGALTAVLLARLRGEEIHATMQIPFGAFLGPALWLVFFANVLAS
jgi:leader peptidase (prepilin peptidase)/N-methyltransferase